MTDKLLIVDDEMPNLRLLERLFSRDYDCLTASSGADAIRLLEQHDVAILITDQRMPQMTGIDLLKQTAELRPHMVRILLTGYTDVEALVEAINSGLVYMYVTKPWNNDELKLKVARACEHYENNKKRHALTLANERLLWRLNEMKLGFVTALTEMLRVRDEHGYGHALRVRDYAIAIAERMGLTDKEREELSAAALLHNFSHVGNSESGLLETESSAVNQSATCQISSEFGRILAAIPEMDNVADMIGFQRENFDGSGYPSRWKEDEIPLSCRILRVADEFDSLVRPRALATPLSNKEAMNSLMDRAGKEFDLRVVQTMAQLLTADSVGAQTQMSAMRDQENIDRGTSHIVG
jgi:response regulator RpfG family c-di-GMP phosphodiesterase